MLLYGTELAGKNYEEAAEILFDRCVKLGYFSASRENNAVLVSASLSEGGKDEKMTLEMKKLLSEEFPPTKSAASSSRAWIIPTWSARLQNTA